MSDVISGSIDGVAREDLDLAATLTSGQAFRWTPTESGGWAGVLGTRRVWLKQDGSSLVWRADGDDAEAAVRAFLRLDDADLPGMAEDWCRRDAAFAEAWARQPGVRILRQEPDECFFSFLCASVAPIRRISAMLRGVADRFGEPLGDLDGVPVTAFPSAARLAEADEGALRDLGLGFRAKRVAEAARYLTTKDDGWLATLRSASHADARLALTAFFGVGAKIADCVCLFALDKDGAIPVDTHIWRIARARYVPELDGKSLTDAAYARVEAAFHEVFGPKAGWAQQTLFYRAAVGKTQEL